MPEHIVSFECHAAETIHPAEDWIDFCSAPLWVDHQQDADGFLYCLSPAGINKSLQLSRLGPDSEAAEREFACFCDRRRAIGVGSGLFF